jgi:hypothetical protein
VQGYSGNGLQCSPDVSCQQDPTLCGVDASCGLTTAGHYECQCNEGFTGDGNVCKGKFPLRTAGMNCMHSTM